MLARGGAATPAMARGITDDCWTVHALVWLRVLPPRWSLPNSAGGLNAHATRG